MNFSASPLWEDTGLPLAIMGVLVVFLTLSLIILFISVLPRFFAVSEPAAAPPQPAASLKDGELDDETVAVIAAAVAMALPGPHRVIRIRGLTSEDLGWSLEGRMQHHQSHQPRRRDR